MSALAKAQGKPRIEGLTGLRGLAAWLVVFYHARLNLTDTLPAWSIDFAGYGYLAVDMFFMLSGFVLWLNYGADLRRKGLAAAPGFWWRRFARIWPLHVAILSGLVCFAVLLALTGRDTAAYPFAELPLHVLLVQNWGFTPELSWNHPAWSISTELAAYLLFPFAVLALRWEQLSALALIGIAVLLIFVLHFAFAISGYDNLGAAIARMGLIRCLAEFALGMVMANLWFRWRAHGATAFIAAFAWLSLLLAMAGGLVAETLGVPAAFAALLLAVACSKGLAARLLGSRALVWLGEVSYATYLVHFPFFILVKLVAVDEGLQFSALEFGGYCLLLLAVSGGLYHGLEKPAQRWLNRHSPGRVAQVRAPQG